LLTDKQSPCPAGTLLACEDVGALGLRDMENTKQALCVWKTNRCFYSFFLGLDENDVMEGNLSPRKSVWNLAICAAHTRLEFLLSSSQEACLCSGGDWRKNLVRWCVVPLEGEGRW
jgi:hypothetical protein